MKESAKAQHEADKANFEAVKAESKANWEEAKRSSAERRNLLRKERAEELAEANARIRAAQERSDAAKTAREE